jgi:hypothetical protein
MPKPYPIASFALKESSQALRDVVAAMREGKPLDPKRWPAVAQVIPFLDEAAEQQPKVARVFASLARLRALLADPDVTKKTVELREVFAESGAALKAVGYSDDGLILESEVDE